MDGIINEPDFDMLPTPLQSEVESLRQQLETERMRLAACGVVALANTKESAADARKMLPEYRSYSCEMVERIVDSEIRLRQQLSEVTEYANKRNNQALDLQKQLTECQAALALKDEALEKIVPYRANNGDDWPAKIAEKALAIKPDNSALREW